MWTILFFFQDAGMCTFCNNDIGDEFHYLVSINVYFFLQTTRKSVLKSYYYIRPTMFKFKQL